MNQPANETNVSPELFRMLGYVEQDPKNEPLTFDTIDRCISENQLKLANDLLQTAEQFWPQSVGVLNRKAIVALRNGDPKSAIVELDKILVSGKADIPIRYNLAYANYLIGNYARVCEVIEPALHDVDNTALLDPLYLLSLQQMNETDAAIAFAERRLKVRRNDTELQGVIALLYLDAEKDVEVCRSYTEAALKHNPDHPMALVAASTLSMMDENPSAALAYAQKVVGRNPNDGRAWSSIGIAHMFNLDLQAAQNAMKTAVQNMPGHIGIWHGLAWTQLFQNDVDGAEDSFNSAADIDRAWGETQAGLAVIAYLRGDKAKAQRLMDRAKRLSPTGMTLLYMKFLQLKDAGDLDVLQKFLEDALKRLPSFKGDSVLDMVRRKNANAFPKMKN